MDEYTRSLFGDLIIVVIVQNRCVLVERLSFELLVFSSRVPIYPIVK